MHSLYDGNNGEQWINASTFCSHGTIMAIASVARFGRAWVRTKVYPAWNQGAFAVGALSGAPTLGVSIGTRSLKDWRTHTPMDRVDATSTCTG